MRAGYDLLFARVVRSDWALRHRPVLSTGRDNHTLYTGVTHTEPDGLIAPCHQQCGVENQESEVIGNKVVITCNGCRSSTRFDRAKQKTSSVLDKFFLLKTKYPQGVAPIEWKLPNPTAPRRSATKAVKAKTTTQTKQNPSTSAKQTQTASVQQTHRPRPESLQPSTPLTRSTSLQDGRTMQPNIPTLSPVPADTISSQLWLLVF